MPASRIPFPDSTADGQNDPSFDQEVIGAGEEITIVFDYPLENKTQRKFEGPLTSRELYNKVMAVYAAIYEEEERTSTIPVIPLNERKPIINRNRTNGVYGLWGHDLGDLWVMGTSVHTDGLYYLGVDS